MVARARRGRGRGRGLIRPSLSASDEPSVDESSKSPSLNSSHLKEKEENEACANIVEDQEADDGDDNNTDANFAPMITKVVGGDLASSGIDSSVDDINDDKGDDEETEPHPSPKSAPNGSSSSSKHQQMDSTSNEFEFTVDDTELAEFDVDDVGGGGRRKHPNSRLMNHRDDINKAMGMSLDSGSTSTAWVSSGSTLSASVGSGSTKCVSPSTTNVSAAKTTPKKSKRKFGLEYIVVSLNDEISAAAPPSMKESPHECVLCLPGRSFNATELARHIHSLQHLCKVLELHDLSLYEKHCSADSAEELHAVLCESVPVPQQPVKLLVVASSKLEETRARILEVISTKKESLVKSSPWSSGSGRSEQPQKRQLMNPSSEDAPAKKSRPNTQVSKPVLMLGDERAKELYDASPALQQVCTLSWYPKARLSKLLSGSIIALNSSHQVLIIVGLQNDFVTERTEGTRKLMMMNPDIDEIERSIIKFAHKLRGLNPLLKLFFTLPPYIDFIEYTKKVKRLSQADFARLEDFSCQIVSAYKRLNDTLRRTSKNLFCYNMNITLRSSQKIHSTRPNSASAQMQFPPGTLTSGYGLSPAAVEKVADDLCMRVTKVLTANEQLSPPNSGPKMIQSWADCDNIIVVGDHHTFKFDAPGPSEEVTKNVTLVSERFQPMSSLLERANKMLNPSVDLLVIVGFYREFAQNVINGKYTILEPQVPVKDEIFNLLLKYKKSWTNRFKRLTIVFTIPHVVDFFRYNTATNPGIQKTEQFTNQMNIYTHQFSINIMSFYKDLRPALTLGTTRVWLYHITNSLFDGHEKLLQSIGNFNVKPLFPLHGTLDGFKPSQPTAFKLRSDLIVFISKILRKHPVPVNSQSM
ncbi:hypothetical protein FHG87_018976 [Trinorchestia longiramus]|nr:hypothetical protein FHG87_018976 [Trinorchestia longiramus]